MEDHLFFIKSWWNMNFSYRWTSDRLLVNWQGKQKIMFHAVSIMLWIQFNTSKLDIVKPGQLKVDKICINHFFNQDCAVKSFMWNNSSLYNSSLYITNTLCLYSCKSLISCHVDVPSVHTKKLWFSVKI
jgi:hypothetical protein